MVKTVAGAGFAKGDNAGLGAGAGGWVGGTGGETVMPSQSGGGGLDRREVVEQPAIRSSSSAKNKLPDFNTRTFCGSEPPPQADLGFKPACPPRAAAPSFPCLKILVAITGASGALYAQRLLDNLDPLAHEVHVVQSNYARQVIAEELPDGLRLPDGVKTHSIKSMNAPFASGSNPPDVMVVIPCTMGTLGRIAHGYSEDVLLRAADVVLKEGKKLILVPRETPLNLIHVKNFELLLLAGATILPANPSFYNRPQNVEQVVDTVVARVLDHLGVGHQLVARWKEEKD